MSECTLEMIEGVRCMTALLLLIHARRCAVLQLCCCCPSLESGDFVGAGVFVCAIGDGTFWFVMFSDK